MKKYTAWLLSVFLLLAVSACAGKVEPVSKDAVLTTAKESASPAETAKTQQTAVEGYIKDEENNTHSYSGKWISASGTEYEELVWFKGGSVLDIEEAGEGVVKGYYATIQEPPENSVADFEFEGNLNGDKVEFEFVDSFQTEGKGFLTFEGDSVKVDLSYDSDTNSGDWYVRGGSFHRAKPLDGKTKEIFDYVYLTKEDVVKKLGADYKTVQTGVEGSSEGYCYENAGLTFIFEDTQENRVAWIECSDKIDILGIRAGMNFSQIQKGLGQVPVVETLQEATDRKAYEIEYVIGSCRVNFLSPDEDGSNSCLTLYKRMEDVD